MAFRLAAAPAAQRSAWLAGIAVAVVLALVAAAAGLWTPGGRGALRSGAGWASGLLNNSLLLASQQHADAASAGGNAVNVQQQQRQEQLRGAQHSRGQAGGQPAVLTPAPPQPPPLCGGPDKVRRLADSLAASRQALLEGLEEDFMPYQQGFGLEEVQATADYLKADGEHGHVHTWMEVHNQTVTFPRRQNKQCHDGCDSWFHLLRDRLEHGMRAGHLAIPEGVPILLNVNDASWCPVQADGTSSCTAPLLSIFKSKYDRDIPIPNFKPVFEPIYVPWESKKEVAFFRGAPICSFPSLNGTRPGTTSGANCSRWVVAQLSWDYPELFNATLTANVTQFGGPLWVDMPLVSHQEAAQYKYVLAVDGATAAYRFAFLMATNSVILKQVTDKIEWYYRAVHACEHYLPFWVHNETDVVQLVQQLQGNALNDLVAQHIVANSQAFALTFLSDEFAYWYWQQVVDKYAALYRGPRSGGGIGGGSGGSGSDGTGSSSDGSSATESSSNGSSDAVDASSEAAGSSPGDAGSEAADGGKAGAGGRRLSAGSRAAGADGDHRLDASSRAQLPGAPSSDAG